MLVPNASHTSEICCRAARLTGEVFTMYRRFFFQLPTWRCKNVQLLLACAFLFGLISGILISMSASDALCSTMRAAPFGCVSIFGLLSVLLLPFLFSAFAVYSSSVLLLLCVAFAKAFAFGFVSFAVWAAFGAAGWLIRFLLMFADLIILPLLLWFWYQIMKNPHSWVKSTLVACILACFIGGFDYCFVSPFLANLIS